jgi:hypothetical protein
LVGLWEVPSCFSTLCTFNYRREELRPNLLSENTRQLNTRNCCISPLFSLYPSMTSTPRSRSNFLFDTDYPTLPHLIPPHLKQIAALTKALIFTRGDITYWKSKSEQPKSVSILEVQCLDGARLLSNPMAGTVVLSLFTTGSWFFVSCSRGRITDQLKNI